MEQTNIMTEYVILDIIGAMDNEQQTKFYANLRASGALSEDEIKLIQKMAFYRKILMNQNFSNKVMETLQEKFNQEVI